MCGRFSLTTKESQLNEFFRLAGGDEPYVPRYNGAPTQKLAVITGDRPGHLQWFRWGLIPFWSKELPRTSPVINARAESIDQKPMFRKLISGRRCLVPADGFYEWPKGGPKLPYRFVMADQSLFAMAGLWDGWKSPDGELIHSFTIITTTANKLMEPIHDRMPVILEKEQYDAWLNAADTEYVKTMLKPLQAEKMKAYRVSPKVNSAAAEGPDLILPYEQNDLFSVI